MKVAHVYESRTGNTARAAELSDMVRILGGEWLGGRASRRDRLDDDIVDYAAAALDEVRASLASG